MRETVFERGIGDPHSRRSQISSKFHVKWDIFSRKSYSNTALFKTSCLYCIVLASWNPHFSFYEMLLVEMLVISFKIKVEIKAFILFSQKRKIFQVIVLGEMDRAESSYEAMCFVADLEEEEFISSDAMSKLRQVSFLSNSLNNI